MAINYTEVGWDTSKYVNPTNMNQMDDGIKAACDGVDALDTEIDTKLDIAGGTMTGNLQVMRNDANVRLSVGTSSNSYVGYLEQYRGGYKTELVPVALTADRTLRYPDASGTLALTSDLVTEDLDKSITLAGSATATASFALTVPSGYSIASVTVWTSSSACAAQMSTLSGSVAIARVTNYSAASNTVTVYCRVLYMKS